MTGTRAAVEPAQPASGSKTYVANRSWRRTHSRPATRKLGAHLAVRKSRIRIHRRTPA